MMPTEYVTVSSVEMSCHDRMSFQSAVSPGVATTRMTGPRLLLSNIGLLLSVLAGLAAIASGLGWRLGLWHFRFGLKILEWAAYGAAGGAALSLIALFWPPLGGRGMPLFVALIGLVLGVAVAGYPVYLRHLARSLPVIHDITTDTDNPPAFVAVTPLRAGAENATSYEGAKIAALQHQAYPDVRPAHYDSPPAKIFDGALAAAKGMGWEIVAAVPGEGRIEATDTTFLFHFKDDVVVRVAADVTGTRVDVRSLSRMGHSDFGVNAARIEKFLAALRERMAAAGK